MMSGSVANTTISGVTETAAKTDVSTSESGSNKRGSRNRYGRGPRTSSQQQSSGSNSNKPTRSLFKGDTEDMNGNVFQRYEEQTNRRQFGKTCDALEAYAKKNLTFAEDLAPIFSDDMEAPVLELPEEIPDNPSPVEIAIWDQALREFVKRKSAFQSNLANIHSIILGQCSRAMKDKLKSLIDFIPKTKNNDYLWLLQQIRSITLQFDEQKNIIISLMNAQRSFLTCRQQPTQSVISYLEALRAWAITISQHGGTIAVKPKLIPETDSTGVALTDEARAVKAYIKTIAIALISGADPTKYGTLIAHLLNQYAMGRDKYPSDIAAAYNLLTHYKSPENAVRQTCPVHVPAHTIGSNNTNSPASALTFAQNKISVLGTSGQYFPDIECYKCHLFGRYAGNCLSAPEHTLVQHALMLTQSGPSTIDPSWILLDSQSTISVFNNPSMLTNIRASPHPLRALTNGGHQDSNMVGDFPNLGMVWFNPASIANILSLADVFKICHVTFDTSTEAAFCVHRLDGTIMKFVEHPFGLFVFDAIFVAHLLPLIPWSTP